MRGKLAWTGVAFAAAVFGCADDGTTRRVPWDENQATVIGEDGQAVLFTDLSEGDCYVPLDETEQVCVSAEDTVARCENGETTTEVVVDEDGKVLDVVCIPPDVETVTAIDLEDGEIDQTSNSTALIFEEDGVYDGDLTVDGNKVVLYGNSPADATIDGSLTLEGNKSIVRGVTITGDLDIAKNNPVVVYCVVLGDVYLTANSSKISGCDIWGDVIITGNNTEMHGNRIRGTVTVSGNGTVCSGNQSFDDTNDDGMIADDEVLGDVSCD